MGDGESVMTESPFHICSHQPALVSNVLGRRAASARKQRRAPTMKAVESISAKLRSCAAACRGFCRLDNMAPF